jgi:hypothetical protein
MLLLSRFMNWLTDLFGKKQEEVVKTAADYHREALVNSGKEQFTKLVDMGLRIHAAHLQ